jgi:hypothetical protein
VTLRMTPIAAVAGTTMSWGGAAGSVKSVKLV